MGFIDLKSNIQMWCLEHNIRPLDNKDPQSTAVQGGPQQNPLGLKYQHLSVEKKKEFFFNINIQEKREITKPEPLPDSVSRQREMFQRGYSSGSKEPHTDLLSVTTETVETVRRICKQDMSSLNSCISTIYVNYRKGFQSQKNGRATGSPMSARNTRS